MASLYHFLSILLAFTLVDALQLPKPLGPHSVGTKRLTITDPHRLDSLALARQNRTIYLQLYYPLSSDTGLDPAPWLPPRAAARVEEDWELPRNTLETVETNLFLGGPALFPAETEEGEIPILVFSPPQGSLVAFHTSLLSSLASRGYFIIGVDHPFDSYPLETIKGDSVIPQARTIMKDLPQVVRVRRDDVFSLASSIDVSVICSWLDPSSACKPNDRRQLRFGIFGVGVGADVARLAAQHDMSPYSAAASLDGLLVILKDEKGVKGPILYVAADPEGISPKMLVSKWNEIEGWKMAIGIEGVSKGGMVETGKVPMKDNAPSGERLVEILVEYLTAYWGGIFYDEGNTLLEGPHEEFKEVKWLNLEGNGKRVPSEREKEQLKDLKRVEKELEEKKKEEEKKKLEEKKKEEEKKKVDEKKDAKTGKKDEL